MNRIALPIVIALSLAACAGTAPNPDAPPPPAATACNAEAASSAIGKAATAEVVEQARIAAGAEIARTLRPNQPVTMDFRIDRLNVDVNDRNAVVGLRCG